jgi:hypothetical protein
MFWLLCWVAEMFFYDGWLSHLCCLAMLDMLGKLPGYVGFVLYGSWLRSLCWLCRPAMLNMQSGYAGYVGNALWL